MNKELTEKLDKKYPMLFAGLHKDMNETCMCWGLECGIGWFDLVSQCCEELMQLDEKLEFMQIKEKFGGLRLYLAGGSEEAYRITSKYEDESYNVCEECGSREDVRSTMGWIMVRCSECLKKIEEKQGYPLSLYEDEGEQF